MTRKAVFDASVIVRATVDHAVDAEQWLTRLHSGQIDVFVPDLFYAEVASAYLRQVRQRRMQRDDAVESVATVVGFPLETTSSRQLCAMTLAIAIGSRVTAYDAHYLALAEAEDAVLVTADRALAAEAPRSVLLE